MKKISYLLVTILVMFIGLINVSAMFEIPVSITFYLNDSHNVLNTRPEVWEICFDDSENESNFCLKVTPDNVQLFSNGMPGGYVTEFVKFSEEKDDTSMDMYKLEFDWRDVTRVPLRTQENYKVTIKGISDNENYILVGGTPTNITEDTLNYMAYFSLSGLSEKILKSKFENSLTNEQFLRLRHNIENSNEYTFEEYVAKYYNDEFGSNDFSKPITYSLNFFGSEITKDDMTIEIIKNSDDEEEWNITINYIPEKINPVKVKGNNDGITERRIQLTEDNWEIEVKNLFKRYNGEEITYTLEITDTLDYAFTVSGNQNDGFIINAKYQDEISDLPGNSPSDDNESDNENLPETDIDNSDSEENDDKLPETDLENNEIIEKEELPEDNFSNVQVPNTYDSVIKTFSTLVISLVTMGILKKWSNYL